VAAALAAAHQRAGDLVARYGGEEFPVVIPGASRDGIQATAEHARRRVQELGLPHPASEAAPVVTVSVGVGWTEPAAGVPLEDLVGAADRALYRAKATGRNRVECEWPTSPTR
jgi:diguanylate cyclase (GGDEF)-like protein